MKIAICILITVYLNIIVCNKNRMKVKVHLKSRNKNRSQSKTRTRQKMKNKFVYSADLQNTYNNQATPVDYDTKQNSISQTNGDMSCPCDTPVCPPCILSKTEKKLHEKALKDAKADQKTQSTLIKESDLQEKLFAAAQKYAALVSQYEDEAKDLALKMQKVSSQAETARQKMIKAENQAKQLALKTINTMTVYPPHSVTNSPELTVTNAGFTSTMIKSYEPQYQIKIGDTDSSGYIDPIKTAVYTDAASGETPGLNPVYLKSTQEGQKAANTKN